MYKLEFEYNQKKQLWTISQLLVLWGESGAGKSYLLKTLLGLNASDKPVLANDQPWHKKPLHKRNIGLVEQSPALFPSLSITKNLMFGFSKKKHKVFEWQTVVDMLELAPLLSMRVDQLSGGQKQRVAIGRALLSQPQLLVLDEPLTGLDETLRVKLIDCIKSIKKKVPVILVTHRLDEVFLLADQIVEINQKRILAPVKNKQQMLLEETPLNSSLNLICLTRKGSDYFLGDFLFRLPFDCNDGCVEVLIDSKEIMLSTKFQPEISANNQIEGRIKNMVDWNHHVLVIVEVEQQLFRAEITQMACKKLNLFEGQSIVLLIKSVLLVG